MESAVLFPTPLTSPCGIWTHSLALPAQVRCACARANAWLQTILMGQAKFVGPNKVKYGFPGRVDVGGEVTAKDIIIATGSVPFVPPGASSGTGPCSHGAPCGALAHMLLRRVLRRANKMRRVHAEPHGSTCSLSAHDNQSRSPSLSSVQHPVRMPAAAPRARSHTNALVSEPLGHASSPPRTC